MGPGHATARGAAPRRSVEGKSGAGAGKTVAVRSGGDGARGDGAHGGGGAHSTMRCASAGEAIAGLVLGRCGYQSESVVASDSMHVAVVVVVAVVAVAVVVGLYSASAVASAAAAVVVAAA